MPRPRKLIVNKVLSDEEVNNLEGTWIDESYMKYPVIDYNCDVFYKDNDGSEKLLLKLLGKNLYIFLNIPSIVFIKIIFI